MGAWMMCLECENEKLIPAALTSILIKHIDCLHRMRIRVNHVRRRVAPDPFTHSKGRGGTLMNGFLEHTVLQNLPVLSISINLLILSSMEGWVLKRDAMERPLSGL